MIFREFLLIWILDQRLESIAKRLWEFRDPTFVQKSNLDHVEKVNTVF